jgi:hypothetical protein
MVVVLAAVWPVNGRADETRRVAVGPQYAAGSLHRFWFGAGYRDLWTTPVELPVLDLRTTAGGLTPVRVVGQAQSLGLALRGADGRSYTFRSLDKHPERMLPKVWRDRWPAKVAQDQTSGTHPAAGLILAPLAEAVGVAHTTPRLVVMPDDPALGQFRQAFANQIGTIDEFPLAASGDHAGFMGATEIVPTTELWKRWLAGPDGRIDSRAFLRARVLDLWVNNFDRHRGQWRWMRIPGRALWQPLPEDPDMVLVHHDGQLMASLRTRIPRFLTFEGDYPSRLEGPLMNNFEVDRWLLADLDEAAWTEVARDVQARLTDEVIERALREMPREWYALRGAEALSDLKERRATLVDYVLRVYRYYARDVDVQLTDRGERVAVVRRDDGSVEVTATLADGGETPHYQRRFHPRDTSEVRIYLRGGDDRLTRTGAAGGPILVRVIAGGGSSVVDDSQSGGTDVWRDAGTVDVRRGTSTSVRHRAWRNPTPVEEAPWIEPRSFGHWSTPEIIAGFSPDMGLVAGYGFTRKSWGFRTDPASSVQSLRAVVASGDTSGKVEYIGTFRRPASGLAFQLQTYGSGIDRINFFGYGNDSDLEASRGRYRTKEDLFIANSTLRFEAGTRFETFVGPEVRYSRSAEGPGTILGEQAPIGSGRFGLVALRGGLHFDSRGRPDAHPSADMAEGFTDATGDQRITGVTLNASAFVVPAAWDVESRYGGVDGMVAAYVGSSRAHLAMRVGGRKLSGEYPWFDAADIGGKNNRGYRQRRFAGDSSLFGSVALRSWVAEVATPVVPSRIGLIAFGDIGRVWLKGETSNTWHPSYGGGLLFQPLGSPVTAHAIVGHSKESTLFYFGVGYPF